MNKNLLIAILATTAFAGNQILKAPGDGVTVGILQQEDWQARMKDSSEALKIVQQNQDLVSTQLPSPEPKWLPTGRRRLPLLPEEVQERAREVKSKLGEPIKGQPELPRKSAPNPAKPKTKRQKKPAHAPIIASPKTEVAFSSQSDWDIEFDRQTALQIYTTLVPNRLECYTTSTLNSLAAIFEDKEKFYNNLCTHCVAKTILQTAQELGLDTKEGLTQDSLIDRLAEKQIHHIQRGQEAISRFLINTQLLLTQHLFVLWRFKKLPEIIYDEFCQSQTHMGWLCVNKQVCTKNIGALRNIIIKRPAGSGETAEPLEEKKSQRFALRNLSPRTIFVGPRKS